MARVEHAGTVRRPMVTEYVNPELIPRKGAASRMGGTRQPGRVMNDPGRSDDRLVGRIGLRCGLNRPLELELDLLLVVLAFVLYGELRTGGDPEPIAGPLDPERLV